MLVNSPVHARTFVYSCLNRSFAPRISNCSNLFNRGDGADSFPTCLPVP